MSQSSTLPRTSGHVQMEPKTIIPRKTTNQNRELLYSVGQCWAAFDMSVYMPEKMIDDESDITILHFEDHPFPVLMYRPHQQRGKQLCYKHIAPI